MNYYKKFQRAMLPMPLNDNQLDQQRNMQLIKENRYNLGLAFGTAGLTVKTLRESTSRNKKTALFGLALAAAELLLNIQSNRNRNKLGMKTRGPIGRFTSHAAAAGGIGGAAATLANKPNIAHVMPALAIPNAVYDIVNPGNDGGTRSGGALLVGGTAGHFARLPLSLQLMFFSSIWSKLNNIRLNMREMNES